MKFLYTCCHSVVWPSNDVLVNKLVIETGLYYYIANILQYIYTTRLYIENNTWQNPYHMSYHPETSISAQGPLGPRDDIGRGWYGMWYGFCHVLYTLSYISTEEYYIIWTVFWSIALGYLQFYFCLVSKALKELLNYLSEAPRLPYNLRAVVLKIFCLLLY